VDDAAHDRPLDEQLVAGQVELELGRHGLRIRAAVGDPCLGSRAAAQIATLNERALVDDHLHTRLLAKPRRHSPEDLAQLLRIRGAALEDRKVKILGEPVGLVVALA
jgi:hypothetical protein